VTRKADRGANGSHGHHWIRDEKRLRIYLRDGFLCVWCGRSAPNPYGDKGGLTLDHVITRAEGGTNEANNLVTACVACNSQRKDQSALSWLGWRYEGHAGSHDPGYYAALSRLVRALASPLPALPLSVPMAARVGPLTDSTPGRTIPE